MIRYLLMLFSLVAITQVSTAQSADFEHWKEARKAELTGEDGWLNLVGLKWLDANRPYLIENSEASLDFAEKEDANTIGKFEFGSDSIWFAPMPLAIQKDPRLSELGRMLVYPNAYGSGGVYYKNWKWTIIQRGGSFALRLRDLEHPKINEFQSTPTYDYDPSFRIEAKLEPRFNQTLEIPNVLGQVISWKVIGILHFKFNEQQYELLVVDELGKLFVLFADQTSALETYPTGRYLYVDLPDVKGMTALDFNYAYNPPCAYTDFATCPIPPKLNRLPFSVFAGEKMPEGDH